MRKSGENKNASLRAAAEIQRYLSIKKSRQKPAFSSFNFD